MGTGSSKPPIYKMPTERKQKAEANCLSNIAAIDFGTTYCSLAYRTKGDSAGVTVVRLDTSVQRVPNAILLKVTGKHQVCSMCHCEPEICKSKGVCASDYTQYKLQRTVESANSKALDMPPLTPRGVCCEVVSFGMQAQDEYTKLRENNYENHIFFERVKVTLITNQFHRDVKIKAVDGRDFYAVEVIALVLKYLKENLLNELTRAGHTAIKASDFQWVITVPAIWKPRGKQMMREAAYLAGLCTDDSSTNPAITSLTYTDWPIGIPEEKHPDKVLLAFEPEAAAIELSSSFKESLHFMVVDMGGGTVDITGHEVCVAECGTSSAGGPRVTSQSILEPIGNEFGGTRVNRMFEIFLHKLLPAEKFDAYMKKAKKHRAMWNALVWLEFEKAKVAFGDDVDGGRDIGSYSSDGKVPDVVSLRVDRKLSDLFEEAYFNNHQGIKFNKDDLVLHINYSTVVQEFFKPVAEGAMQCIRQALKQLDSKVDTIYLVGGFGGCKYIHGYIKAALKTDQYANTAIVQAKESFLTVARGAVRYAENPQVITSRKADATYGIVTSVPFVRGDHDPAYSFRDSRGALYCNNVFYMCVEKGGSIPSDVVFTTTLTPPDLQQKKMKLEIVMTDETRAGYTSDKKGKKTVVELGCLIIKLPESSATEDQTVHITLDFSGTELKARARFNHGTSEDIVTIIDFL